MTSSKPNESRGRYRIGRRRLVAITLAALAATIAAIAWPPERFSSPTLLAVLSPLHTLENVGYDALMGAKGHQDDLIDPRIVVVGIDHDDESDKSIHTEWPFPRRTEAAAARNLIKDGAKLVAFDLLFSGPTDPADDKALDMALKGPGNFVLTNRIEHPTSAVREERMETPYHSDDPGGVDFEAHALSGLADIPEENNIVRSMAPVEKFMDQWMPSFPVAAYMKVNGIDPDAKDSIRVDDNFVYIGSLKIPKTGPTAGDQHTHSQIPEVRVDYPAAAAAFYSPAKFNQLVTNDFAPGTFAGKFVFIGLTGPQLTKDKGESFVTSFSRFHPETFNNDVKQPILPGVIVQALNFNALLHHTYVYETSGFADWSIVFFLTLGAVAIVRRFPNLIGLAGVLACAAGLFVAALLCLRYRGIHVPWVVPNILMLTSAGGVGWLESGSIKRKWAGYVSPAVLAQILATEGGLGAKRFDASVMFGDIRGFTSFSEQHSPETVVYLLNRHLERMTAIVARENGTIDKFFGDGILAVFGAPIRFPDSARAAVRAAWLMREAAMQPIKDEDGVDHVLATGFGISSGIFLGGDIGSRQLKNWTIIGDVVNLASRLQGVTGQPDVIIDEPTYREVEAYVDVESLGDVTLKGKAHPVRCYKVTGWLDIPKAKEKSGIASQLDSLAH